MQARLRLLFGALLCTCVALHPAFAQNDTFTEIKSGKTFSKKIVVKVDGKDVTLVATGATEYEKENKKSGESMKYVLAHYMEATAADSGKTIYQTILQKPMVRQMVTVYDFTCPAEQFKKLYGRFFTRVASPEDMKKNEAAIAEFLEAACVTLAAKEQIVFRWLPDNRMIVVQPNGTEKILGASPIAAWFWKSWFEGESSIDRAALVEKLPAH